MRKEVIANSKEVSISKPVDYIEFDNKKAEEFLLRIKTGEKYEEAVENVVGITMNTIHYWIHTNSTFKAELNEAEFTNSTLALNEMLEIADAPLEQESLNEQRVELQRRKLQIDAREKVLKMRSVDKLLARALSNPTESVRPLLVGIDSGHQKDYTPTFKVSENPDTMNAMDSKPLEVKEIEERET